MFLTTFTKKRVVNILDIFLVLPLIYGFYSGFSKGVIRQLTGLIGGLLAVLFGFKLSGYLRVILIENNLINPEWAGVVGFIVTVLGIILSLKLAGEIVRKTTRFIGLGFIEKLIGAALGVVKFGLITMVLLTFFVKINTALEITPESTFLESQLYPYYMQGFNYLYNLWAIES